MIIDEINIDGAVVSHHMDKDNINHFEIRKSKCIGFGQTYQEALKDLQNKIIKRTLSESQKII